MIERTLAMGNHLTINDVRRVVAAAKEIGDDEELILSVNSQEAHKAANIFAVLENNDFECTTKGGHDGKDYFIIAKRKQL